MNLDNQGVVSGTFLRQRWVLFLVDGGIYLTESFYKWYFITMEYTTPPQKYWIYRKINAWDDQEVWTLVGKATEFLDQMGILYDRGWIFLCREGDNSYSISMTIFGYNPKLSLWNWILSYFVILLL